MARRVGGAKGSGEVTGQEVPAILGISVKTLGLAETGNCRRRHRVEQGLTDSTWTRNAALHGRWLIRALCENRN
ncbi:MAG: hypothetical protein KKD12_06575 [Proteobacteria bacterium]|nr:hypothetical protein [Pseudomonadota bacterium]MBU4389006.1 hypothetical protein [Pseudomonadota bacterium]